MCLDAARCGFRKAAAFHGLSQSAYCFVSSPVRNGGEMIRSLSKKMD
jgi:hypothetical protein